MTIYVVESHPLMSQAIVLLLRRVDTTKKIVEIHSFNKLQEVMLINGAPEAFVIEPLTTGINGTSSITQIKNNYPNTPLIIFSSIPSIEAEQNCLNAGADLYIEKTNSLHMLFTLVKSQLSSPEKLGIIKSPNPLYGDHIKFSKRQKQLLILVDAGLSNDEIANELEISSHTVKVHLWRFYKKLGICSRTQLIKFARDSGYL